MTKNEATNLNEQMKELEKLEMEKKLKNQPSAGGQAKKPESTSFASKFSLDSLGLLSKSSAPSSVAGAATASNPGANDSEMTANASANFQAFKDMFTNANDEFEREWQSAFASNEPVSSANTSANAEANLSPTQTEFGFFTSAGMTLTSASSSAGAQPSLFATQDLLKPMSPESLSTNKSATEPNQALPAANKQSTTAKVSSFTISLCICINPDELRPCLLEPGGLVQSICRAGSAQEPRRHWSERGNGRGAQLLTCDTLKLDELKELHQVSSSSVGQWDWLAKMFFNRGLTTKQQEYPFLAATITFSIYECK